MSEYRTLMVCTDFSPLSEIATRAAIDTARLVNARRIHFEHVVQTTGSLGAAGAGGFPFADWEIDRIFKQGLREAQEKLAAISVDLPGVEITRNARLGLLGRELARAAEEVHADLVFVGSHGYGLIKRAFLGSAASGLIRAAHCPVLVVGEHRSLRAPVERVLAAVDLSPVSEKVLEHSVRLMAKGGELTVLSLYEYPLVSAAGTEVFPRYVTKEEISRYGDQHASRVKALLDRIPHDDIKVRVEVMAKAPASQVILDLTQVLMPDVIALGTSGHSAWHRMIIGSTATRVLNDAGQPVLVVPFDVKS